VNAKTIPDATSVKIKATKTIINLFLIKNSSLSKKVFPQYPLSSIPPLIIFYFCNAFDAHSTTKYKVYYSIYPLDGIISQYQNNAAVLSNDRY